MKILKKIKSTHLLLAVLVLLLLFFRVYQIEDRNQFTYDQVDNAWAAKTIIIDRNFPIEGMQVKQNTGLFIGPLYYYYIVPFYLVFNLDPVASGYIAAFTSVISILILYFITKKIFSSRVGIIASLIYIFLLPYIEFDRIQWPVNFVPAISLVIFYSTYKILTNNLRYFFLLMLSLGLSFHFHMTSVFYVVILFFCLPFFPRKKDTIKYFFYSLPIFIVLISPILYLLFVTNQISTGSSYASSSYHGIHLRRILQLANDAFLEFAVILHPFKIKILRFVLPALFFFIYLKDGLKRERIVFCYLILLWILVPWILLSGYSGELTAYYFIIPRFIIVIMTSYLIAKAIFSMNKLISVSSITAFILFLVYNFNLFIQAEYQGMSYYRKRTLEQMKRQEPFQFTQGAPEPYIYYYYTHAEKK